jgi:hypothetical protein
MNTMQVRFMLHINGINQKLRQIMAFDKTGLTDEEIADLRQSFTINQMRLENGIKAFQNPLHVR